MNKYLGDEHFIFTSENPAVTPKYPNVPSVDELAQFLTNQGEDAEVVEGHYGKPERSVLVRNPKNAKGLHQMASDFGQESAIHSKGGKHEIHFYNGLMAGSVVPGEGTKFFEHKPEDNYTKIHTPEGPLYFQHQFNFDKTEPLTKPYVSEAQRRWAHTESGEDALGGKAGVHEWDEATRGKHIPERAHKTEDLDKSKNVREQKKKVFGTNAAPKAGSDMQKKHINHIKEFAKKFLDLKIHPSGGKIDPDTGKRRDKDAEAGVDKPDWRSGHLEAQWNPDALIHEIAHLMLLPAGVGLEAGQELMDKQYGDVQRKYGYMKQKRSMGEVQPMAAEQLIRRAIGLPANRNAVPAAGEDAPPRTAVEDPSNIIGTRIKAGKNKKGEDKWVDLIRQSRFLSPENKIRMERVFSKKIIFHPERGWVENPDLMVRDPALTRQPSPVHTSPVGTSPIAQVSPQAVVQASKLASSEADYENLAKVKDGPKGKLGHGSIASQPMRIKLGEGGNKGREAKVVGSTDNSGKRAFRINPATGEKNFEVFTTGGKNLTTGANSGALWNKDRKHKVIKERVPWQPAVQGVPNGRIAEGKDTHPFLTHSAEQKKLVHGVNLNQVNPSGEGWTGEWAVSGFGHNSKKEKVYVKGAMPEDQVESNEMGDEYNDLTTAQREGLYHNLAHLIGLGQYVPTTSVVNDNGDHYSVMRLIPGGHHYEDATRKDHETMANLRDSGEIDKLAIMNTLFGNTDRHGGNYMLSPKGLHMIDHGLTFDWHGNSGRPIAHPAYHQHAYRLNGHSDSPADEPVHEEAVKWLSSLNPKQLQDYFKNHAKVPSHISEPLVGALQEAQKVLKLNKGKMTMGQLRNTIISSLGGDQEDGD